MSMLIGGGILIGTTLATIAIVQAIPAEVLPLKVCLDAMNPFNC